MPIDFDMYSWQSAGSAPSFVTDNESYMCGTDTESGIIYFLCYDVSPREDRFYRFDPLNGFIRLADPPVQWSASATCFHNGKFWVAFGSDRSEVNDNPYFRSTRRMYSYDPGFDQWSTMLGELAEVNAPTTPTDDFISYDFGKAVGLGDSIYVVGAGYWDFDVEGQLADNSRHVFEFDTISNVWSDLGTVYSSAREGGALYPSGSDLYNVAGWDNGVWNVVDRFFPTFGNVDVLPVGARASSHDPKFGVTSDGKLYFFGMVDFEGGVGQQYGYLWDPDNGWQQGPPHPYDSYFSGFFGVIPDQNGDDAFYMLNASGGVGFVKYALDPASNAPPRQHGPGWGIVVSGRTPSQPEIPPSADYVSFIGSGSESAGNGNGSLDVFVPSQIIPVHAVIVGVTYGQLSDTHVVTDNQGNVWTKYPTETIGFYNGELWVCHVTQALHEGDSITYSWHRSGGANFTQGAAFWRFDVGPGWNLEVLPDNSIGINAPETITVPDNVPTILVGHLGTGTSTGRTSLDGMTGDPAWETLLEASHEVNLGSSWHNMVAYKIVGSAATYTWDTNPDWIAGIIGIRRN